MSERHSKNSLMKHGHTNLSVFKEIIDYRDKLLNKELYPVNEESTKQKLVLTLLKIFGFDQTSNEIIPELNIQPYSDNNLKIDYLITKTDKPITFIECKKYTISLDEHYGNHELNKAMNQVKSYLMHTGFRYGVLTNGDNIYIFTLDDTKLKKILGIKITEATESELKQLEKFHISNINADDNWIDYSILAKQLDISLKKNPISLDNLSYNLKFKYEYTKEMIKSMIEKLDLDDSTLINLRAYKIIKECNGISSISLIDKLQKQFNSDTILEFMKDNIIDWVKEAEKRLIKEYKNERLDINKAEALLTRFGFNKPEIKLAISEYEENICLMDEMKNF